MEYIKKSEFSYLMQIKFFFLKEKKNHTRISGKFLPEKKKMGNLSKTQLYGRPKKRQDWK